MLDESSSREGKSGESPSCTTHDAHDITSLSDLPGKKIRTKLWPMSPIESLSAEEVMAIAHRDHTPIMISRILDGDDKGTQYVCSNKKGASLPPEIAAEGSWAQKYYQQVVVLNDTVKDLSDTVKDMKEKFQPVWELAKGQQVLSVSVEVFDGLLAVANEGFQQFYQGWTSEGKKSIITKDCDFRSPNGANYYSVLKNYSMGRFSSLDSITFSHVEDLLGAGELYLMSHAGINGFHCPANIRAMMQRFIPLKSDRNCYSHPLSLSEESLATIVLQRLRVAVANDEFDFMKDSKNLILLGADYAESVLQSYGKVKDSFFINPKPKSRPRSRQKSTTLDNSPKDSPPHSPLRPRSPNFPLFGLEDFQVGQTSQSSSTHKQPRPSIVVSTQDPHLPPYVLNPNALEYTPCHHESPTNPPTQEPQQGSHGQATQPHQPGTQNPEQEPYDTSSQQPQESNLPSYSGSKRSRTESGDQCNPKKPKL